MQSEQLDYMDASIHAIQSFTISSTRSLVHTVGSGKTLEVFVSVHFNNFALKMELDTGSDNSVPDLALTSSSVCMSLRRTDPYGLLRLLAFSVGGDKRVRYLKGV